MSAGKGDSPRRVNGDDAIFAPKYPEWICRPCGEAHGRGMPAGHIATWHKDVCGICGRRAQVTEPRDFGHLKKWPIAQKKSCTNARNHAQILAHATT